MIRRILKMWLVSSNSMVLEIVSNGFLRSVHCVRFVAHRSKLIEELFIAGVPNLVLKNISLLFDSMRVLFRIGCKRPREHQFFVGLTFVVIIPSMIKNIIHHVLYLYVCVCVICRCTHRYITMVFS